jgi:epoxyqueuosine reductase
MSPEAVKGEAVRIGLRRCGSARAVRHPRLARLATWIGEGRAGEMTYLERSLDERSDPARVLPTARSIVSLAVLYNDGTPEPAAPAPGRAIVSRHAWGDDYHDVIRHRLTALVRWMADAAGPGFEAFSAVDNAPVQERVFA